MGATLVGQSPMYRLVESLCCVLETYVTLCVISAQIKNKNQTLHLCLYYNKICTQKVLCQLLIYTSVLFSRFIFMAVTNSAKSHGKASSTQFLGCRFYSSVEKIKCNKSIAAEKKCANIMKRQKNFMLIYNIPGKIGETQIFVIVLCFCE